MFGKLQNEYKTNNCRVGYKLLTICDDYLIRVEFATQRLLLGSIRRIHAGLRPAAAGRGHTAQVTIDGKAVL
jgi:hypothetical protein